MITSAKVRSGKVIHRAIDMGGFLYIACHADPTTLKTESVRGEVTCKKCLALKSPVVPKYQFADGVHALYHPFCRKNDERDGFGAGWHDGKHNLKKHLQKGLNEEFSAGYNEGYHQGQQNYTYHFNQGNVKSKPLTNLSVTTIENKSKNSGCLVFILLVGAGLAGIVQLIN